MPYFEHATDINPCGSFAGRRTGQCWLCTDQETRTWVHVDCGAPPAAKILMQRLNRRPLAKARLLMSRAQAKRYYINLYEDEVDTIGVASIPRHPNPAQIARMVLEEAEAQGLVRYRLGRFTFLGEDFGDSPQRALDWLEAQSTIALHLFIRLRRGYKSESLLSFLKAQQPKAHSKTIAPSGARKRPQQTPAQSLGA